MCVEISFSSIYHGLQRPIKVLYAASFQVIRRTVQSCKNCEEICSSASGIGQKQPLFLTVDDLNRNKLEPVANQLSLKQCRTSANELSSILFHQHQNPGMLVHPRITRNERLNGYVKKPINLLRTCNNSHKLKLPIHRP